MSKGRLKLIAFTLGATLPWGAIGILSVLNRYAPKLNFECLLYIFIALFPGFAILPLDTDEGWWIWMVCLVVFATLLNGFIYAFVALAARNLKLAVRQSEGSGKA